MAGAAGGIGEEIVRALTRDAATTVYAGSRSEPRLARLMESVSDCDTSRIVPFLTDLTSVAAASASASCAARASGGFDALVASLGGWWQGGPLLDVDERTWRDVTDEMLTSHFIFARAFLPELLKKPGGLYVAIGGGAALAPICDAALVSIAGAAQIMLTRALAKELRHADVEIVELLIDGPVRTRESPAGTPDAWMTASDAGRVVAELVTTRRTSWPRSEWAGPLLTVRPAR